MASNGGESGGCAHAPSGGRAINPNVLQNFGHPETVPMGRKQKLPSVPWIGCLLKAARKLSNLFRSPKLVVYHRYSSTATSNRCRCISATAGCVVSAFQPCGFICF
uniref:Uncharacterized protein n=1 Tax=Anopheles funestus TaxID=62324 RepID=A0A182RNR7_ANOFN